MTMTAITTRGSATQRPFCTGAILPQKARKVGRAGTASSSPISKSALPASSAEFGGGASAIATWALSTAISSPHSESSAAAGVGAGADIGAGTAAGVVTGAGPGTGSDAGTGTTSNSCAPWAGAWLGVGSSGSAELMALSLATPNGLPPVKLPWGSFISAVMTGPEPPGRAPVRAGTAGAAAPDVAVGDAGGGLPKRPPGAALPAVGGLAATAGLGMALAGGRGPALAKLDGRGAGELAVDAAPEANAGGGGGGGGALDAIGDNPGLPLLPGPGGGRGAPLAPGGRGAAHAGGRGAVLGLAGASLALRSGPRMSSRLSPSPPLSSLTSRILAGHGCEEKKLARRSCPARYKCLTTTCDKYATE